MSSSSYADFHKQADDAGALGDPILPADEYVGRVVSVKITSANGDKKIGVRLEITQGPLAGKKVTSWLNLKKAKPTVTAIFFNTANKFGMGKEFWFRTPAPTDSEVESHFSNKAVRFTTTEPSYFNGKASQFVNVQEVLNSNPTALVGAAAVAAVTPVAPAHAVVATGAGLQPPAAFNPLGGPVAQAG